MPKSFNAQQAVATLLGDAGALPSKAKNDDLRQMLLVSAAIVRSANARAKIAEEKLREMPNYQSKHHDMSQLYRSCLSALKTAEADAQALETRRGAHEAELARWREESEKQFDACNSQLEEKDGQIKLLVEQLDAALELLNCKDVVARASVEVANAKAVAGIAELRLVSLGIKVSLPDVVAD